MSVFSEVNRQTAVEIVGRYPERRSAVLPLLHLVQDQEGWVSAEAMAEVAGLLGLEPAEVLGVCSFYTMLKRRPVGKYVVSVCTNVSCLVNGGPALLEHLRARYADDDEVHVEEVECLAACDGAPSLQVNYEFHERMSPGAADRVIAAYTSGERRARTVSGTARPLGAG